MPITKVGPSVPREGHHPVGSRRHHPNGLGTADGGVGTSTVSIAYIAGAPPTGGIFAGAPVGYSVYASTSNGPGSPTNQVSPIGTPIPVKLVAEAKLSCAGVSPWPSGEKGGTGLDNVVSAPVTGLCPNNVPLAGQSPICVGPGLNTYISQVSKPTSPFVLQACGPVTDRCLVRSSPAAIPFQPLGSNPPAGWPCP